jgi:hypothetical protein
MNNSDAHHSGLPDLGFGVAESLQDSDDLGLG